VDLSKFTAEDKKITESVGNAVEQGLRAAVAHIKWEADKKRQEAKAAAAKSSLWYVQAPHVAARL
jgi:hypothetical protein